MKKLSAVIVCVVMLISLFVPYAFAAEKPDYLSLGDSIAYGASLTDRKSQVAGAIVSRTNGYNYKNDAVSGHTTEMMLRKISESKVENDIKEAEIICISIGGNDFLGGGLPELLARSLAGDYSKLDAIKEKLYANIDRIIDAVRELNPDAAILFHTLYNPMFVSNTLRRLYQYAADRTNQAVNEYLDANPGAYTVVDVASAFGDDEGLIAFDYIHPNAYGQEVIAREILKTLKEMGLGTSTDPVLERDEAAFIVEDMVIKFRKVLEVMFFFIRNS